ncbi:hypothetical protein B0P06_003724 [Clostridium saccharoperbutylacetonicum]|jgi:hypothetical protein|uniref:Uncharacterized protein n=1 Tax=Clostridium saccharoperbutylacetonicum N1-4(HMT) TaxID=931276 RepID=M1MTC0_9CLOT|nr:hypothetical protein Cspa_c42130 [Clostridium saccharoperbutylacetonicum N1-4(HMT)]NRT61261.1 hypothetical protein [Clostridium saccharoperbutylacetonicum]NSB24578.1 hypothetical protein [Clostridium saccharoperbutylacetonicum]NSB43953.1 hypothetical protein [Clostridium saccharoperbutylacetonicum]
MFNYKLVFDLDIQINTQTYKWNIYASLRNYNRNTTLEIRYIFVQAAYEIKL